MRVTVLSALVLVIGCGGTETSSRRGPPFGVADASDDANAARGGNGRAGSTDADAARDATSSAGGTGQGTKDAGPTLDAAPDATSDAASDAGGGESSREGGADAASCGASAKDAADTGCILSLVRGDQGDTWICYDPRDPENRSGDLPYACEDSAADLEPACNRVSGKCSLGGPPMCCGSGSCTLPPGFDSARCDPMPGPDPICLDLPPDQSAKCPTGASCSLCVHCAPRVDMHCASDLDCVPEPCGHPTVCVNAATKSCSHSEGCARDGLCHVPISCTCRGGTCAASLASSGCH